MNKSAAINMRVKPRQHTILTKASEILGKDRSAFILDVACREAENVLLDQRLFVLNGNDFDAFEEALAKPLPENSKLEELMSKPSPWE